MQLSTKEKKIFLSIPEDVTIKTLNYILENNKLNMELTIYNIQRVQNFGLVLLTCSLMCMIISSILHIHIVGGLLFYSALFTFVICILLITHCIHYNGIYYPKLNKNIRKDFSHKTDQEILIDIIYNYELVNIKNYETYLNSKNFLMFSWIGFIIMLLLNVSSIIFL